MKNHYKSLIDDFPIRSKVFAWSWDKRDGMEHQQAMAGWDGGSNTALVGQGKATRCLSLTTLVYGQIKRTLLLPASASE